MPHKLNINRLSDKSQLLGGKCFGHFNSDVQESKPINTRNFLKKFCDHVEKFCKLFLYFILSFERLLKTFIILRLWAPDLLIMSSYCFSTNLLHTHRRFRYSVTNNPNNSYDSWDLVQLNG